MKTKRREGAQEAKKASSSATHGKWHDMNRKQRREMMRKIQSEALSLEVIHPDAAGIDIGNESHYVAVPPSRDSQSVQRLRMHHCRVEGDGRLAEAMQHSHRRDAIN
jgi:hypothetical protein